ncbi:protein-S-isoprenylcysteine O-methyltransferase [Myxococcaceae bacterium]|jgi:protein-S-isoprenylcysteine O-methyltransferase Ste14|nr:protein-S-isoprenylcysteine O-methyltransferase [Myxococcaceae bacterium]
MAEIRRPPYLPPVLVAGCLALMVLLHFALPLGRWLDPPLTWIGLLPLGIGIGLLLGSSLLFRKRETTIVPFRESSALLTEGPYRYTRNPIYLGMLVALAGVAMLLGTRTPLLVIPLFFVLITNQFIVNEEAMLEERFGEAYDEYRRKVRRWI